MSNPGLHKLARIGAYVMQENVHQDQMQGRYAAAALINQIIKEIKLGIEMKKQTPKKGRKGTNQNVKCN
jgi:hypothetical protein